MVNGLDLVKKYFDGFDDCYTVIGGTACSILYESNDLDFRPTMDIDMILLVDSPRFPVFADKLLKLIDDGGYSCEERRSNKTKRLYRFIKPQNPGFPSMIELFSRNALSMKGNRRITYVETGREPSGLSAMLLSDTYYNFVYGGRVNVDGVWTLQVPYLIPLKMYAWLNLKKDRDAGKDVDENDLQKHKFDVFRLLPLVQGEMRVALTDDIRQDVETFINAMSEENITGAIFGDDDRNIALRENFYRDRYLSRLRDLYL